MVKKSVYINQDVVNLYKSAGFTPPYPKKTVEKIEAAGASLCNGVKDSIKRQLRIIDE